MADEDTHLIERAARRLVAEGGLLDPSAMGGERRAPSAPAALDGGSAPFAPSADVGPPTESASDAEPKQPLAGVVRARGAAAVGASAGVANTLADRLAEPRAAPAAALVGVPGAAAALAEQPGGKALDISLLERGGMVVGRKSRTRISEEFRIAVGHVLRSLQNSYTAGHGSANLIMVTSSRPGEGKSFTAMNLAGCIAQQNQREVLLVDIDAKQRPITFELGLGDAPGLLDLVRDPSLRIEDVIVPTSIPSLSFLPIGARLTSNEEMPLSRPISAVVERLGRRFANRVIILDAPPCLSTSDPSALAPIVGQILMVVEAERTQRNELVAALEMVRVCPTITLLLNKIQLTTSYTFGAYHYFGTYS